MSCPHNYEKFPNNVYPPRTISISNDEYTLYKFSFKGLQDFYDFLKSNPKINTSVWSSKLSSVSSDFEFAGIPYKKAIEKLVQEMDPGYQEYLKIQKQMKATTGYVHKYREIKSIAGGIVNPVDYTSGSPTIYRTSRIVKQPKFITINTQLAYYWGTSKSQVFNRALIITNLIRALERQGYIVNLNSFMLAENDGELIEAIFELKKVNQKINYQALYKSLVDVEFFRRLCFRLIEISDVKSDWNHGYGHTCEKSMATYILKLGKDDIYFDQPSSMSIYGDDIGDDFESVVDELELKDVIDVKREKEALIKGVKVLKK